MQEIEGSIPTGGHMSERFFRSNRPGYPHPVSSELENSGFRVAVSDCSVTELWRWRPPYQAGKTVHVHAKHYKHNEDGRTAPGVCGNGSAPLSHSGMVVTRMGIHTHISVYCCHMIIVHVDNYQNALNNFSDTSLSVNSWLFNRPFSHCFCACIYWSCDALFPDDRGAFTQMGQTDFKPLTLCMYSVIIHSFNHLFLLFFRLTIFSRLGEDHKTILITNCKEITSDTKIGILLILKPNRKKD